MTNAKYIPVKQVDDVRIIAVLADMLAHRDFHKHERKEMLDKSLQKAYKTTLKIRMADFELISRKAEKYNLAYANMTLNEAKAWAIRKIRRVASDPSAQNRDVIMAVQIMVNMAGLDAKFNGGFDDDCSDEVVNALAAIAEDEQHNALSELNSDEPEE